MALPQVRLQPWYPGQMGVPGSDVPRGLRTSSAGVVLYVAADHPNATATADGTDPENPLTTITAAMARLVTFHAEASIQAENSVIVVSPGVYTDNIDIADATYPEGCTLLAAGATQFDVIWRPASGDALVLNQSNWVVDGFHFQPPDDGAGIKLTWDTTGGHGAVIQNCFFNGRWGTGLYGLELSGSPYNVTIQDNWFTEFSTNQAAIITIANTVASAFQNLFLRNFFQECAQYITNTAEGYNACIFADNIFAVATGLLAATTTYMDLGGPGHGYNQVVGNYFPGDYSNVGGYTAEGAGTDSWYGNFAEDVTEAEVGDNGITILPPT